MNITTKFDPGDTVWFIHANKVMSGKVVTLRIHVSQTAGARVVNVVGYDSTTIELLDSMLFPDKPSLLASL